VVIQETLESGLQLAGSVLDTLGVSAEVASRLLDHERQRRAGTFREA
jgi:CPA2 family monovalent cation:H+ antiporter-2